MSFSGKVVLVTGASSGIGAATAVLFAKEGANVALVGRNDTKLNEVARQCAAQGPPPLIIKADLADQLQVSTIIQKTIDRFGQLDVLINNAGFLKSGSLLDGKILEAYDAIMQTNVRAVIHLTTLATPYLIKTKGNIINTSSVGSLRATANTQAVTYSISKAALDHFTRCAASELAPFGVRVNSINPGPVKTDIMDNVDDPDALWERLRQATALKRLGTPDEIAELMLFLASDKARSITGAAVVSDNGFLLFQSEI